VLDMVDQSQSPQWQMAETVQVKKPREKNGRVECGSGEGGRRFTDPPLELVSEPL
jgi:hypothetical protein